MNTGAEIKRLLHSSNIPAPDITRPLKKIGGGNMLDGLRAVYDYAYTEGAQKYTEGSQKYFVIGGVVMLGIGGTAYLGYHGVKFVKSKIEAHKEHKQIGNKIYAAFSEELADNPKEEVNDEEN